jgi:16S rRNA (uracil1498-N3)-methyltransferase
MDIIAEPEVLESMGVARLTVGGVGVGSGIRTHDIRNHNPALYQTELYPPLACLIRIAYGSSTIDQMARRRFFVEEVCNGRAVVRGEEAHHLRRVLRVEAGQVFEISDTRRVYVARVTAAHSSAIEFVVEEEIAAGPALAPVTLFAAVFKFDRLEWMIEKATELGVASVVPIVAARTEKHLAEAAVNRVERWRRVAVEAAQQARRLAPPEVSDVTPFERAIQEAATGRRWMLDESETSSAGGPLLDPAPQSGSALLTGPEGGWTDEERRRARDAGFQPVGLGPLVLRAETAAIAALSVLLYVGLNSGTASSRLVPIQ